MEASFRDERPFEWLVVPAENEIQRSSVQQVGTGDVTIVLDDAHRRPQLDRDVALLESREPSPQIVLVARSGFEDRLSTAVPVRVGADVARISVGPLRRRDVDQLLRAEPFSISQEGRRAVIVQLAEGNPQIAQFAAELSTQGIDIGGLTRHAIFARHAASVVAGACEGSRERKEILGVTAALGGLDLNATETWRGVGALLGLDESQIRRELETLADRGPLVEQNQRYTIKPDLLADQILRTIFFPDDGRPTLDFVSLLRALGAGSAPTLLETLSRAAWMAGADVSPAAEVIFRELRGGWSGDTDRFASYARFARAFALISTDFAFPLIDLVMQGLSQVGLDEIDSVAAELSAALVTALRNGQSGFEGAWKRLLRLISALVARGDTPDAIVSAKEELLKVYTYVPIGISDDAGLVLAAIQELARRVTQQFWTTNRGQPGAAEAVAAAARLLLSQSFEITRYAADDAMKLNLIAVFVPGGADTLETFAVGASLARETFPLLAPGDQLELIESFESLARTATGFAGPFGASPSESLMRITDQAISQEIDGWAMQQLEEVPVTVGVKLLEYFSIRSNDDIARGVPEPRGELREYVDLIEGPHFTGVASYEQEIAAQETRASVYANRLASEQDPIAVIERWNSFIEERLERDRAFQAGTLRRTLGLLAKAAPDVAMRIAEHLFSTDAVMLAYADDLVRELIAILDPEAEIGRWSRGAGQAKRTVAAAIGGSGSTAEAEVLTRLAKDDDPTVRTAVWYGLQRHMRVMPPYIQALVHLIRTEPDPELLTMLVETLTITDEDASAGELAISDDNANLVKEALLRSAELARGPEPYALVSALTRAAEIGHDWTMEWVWARIESLARARRSIEPRDLPSELRPLVQARLSTPGWEEHFNRACRWLEGEDLPWRVQEALVDLIAWLGTDTPELRSQLVGWVQAGDVLRRRALEILRHMPWGEKFADAARAILEVTDDDDVVWAIALAHEPRSFVGSQEPYYRAAATRFVEWSDDPVLSRVGDRAIEYLTKRADDAAREHEARGEEY
jgi:hypothetical protein